MRIFERIILPALFLLGACLTPLAAQEIKADINEADIKVEVKTAFERLAGLIEQDKFDEAEKLMTKKGANEYAADQLGEALAFTQFDIEEMGDFDPESKKEMELVQEKYRKLTEQFGISELKFSDESEEQYNAFNRKLLKMIDEQGNRWAAVQAIREVTKDSSSEVMEGDIFCSKFVQAELTSKKMATLELRPDVQDLPEDYRGFNDAVKFKNVDGTWKFHGLDWDKMDEFMAESEHSSSASFTIEETAFSGDSAEDKKIALADFRNKVVLVDFWGTWCGPCVASLPELQRLRDAMQEHEFEIIGIAADNAQTFLEFNNKKKLVTWPNIIDAEGKLSEQFGISAYPTTLLIDQHGNHVATDLHGDSLVAKIGKLLELTDDQVSSIKKTMAQAKKSHKSDDSSMEESSTPAVGFDVADSDQNGEVSKSELKSYLSERLDGEIPFKKVFRKLDSDKDKSISESEFENRFEVIESTMGRGDSSREMIARPGPKFVPFEGLNKRVDDQAIFGALANRYWDLEDNKSTPWPDLDFKNLPRTYEGKFSFGLTAAKPTVEHLAKSTLIIIGGGEELGTAGGIVISEDGLVVTNFHVAEMAKNSRMAAMTTDGKMHRVIKVYAGVNEKDVALLQLEGSGYTPVPIAKSAPQAGDDIVMLHHSENRFYTYDRGYVQRNSKIGRNTRMEISSEYAPGGSGCGIFNSNHELVGLVCEIAEGSGPALASGDMMIERGEETFNRVKHAVHLSSIHSLWSQENPATTSVPMAVKDEPNNASKSNQPKPDKKVGVKQGKNFDAPVILMAGDQPMKAMSGYVSPAVFDIDNDGVDEMVLGGIAGELLFCENKGTAEEPKWGDALPVMTDKGDELMLQNW